MEHPILHDKGLILAIVIKGISGGSHNADIDMQKEEAQRCQDDALFEHDVATPRRAMTVNAFEKRRMIFK
jgi:hypothetical protein